MDCFCFVLFHIQIKIIITKNQFHCGGFESKTLENLEPLNKYSDFFGHNYTSKQVNAIIHGQRQENRCKSLLSAS